MKKIALFGATGFIGKSLTYEFCKRNKFKVFLFSRSKNIAEDFLKSIGGNSNFSVHKYVEFTEHQYDAVLNCTGMGNPAVLKKYPADIFKVTEEFDNLSIEYAIKNPEVLYINLSTGVVYGNEIGECATDKTKSVLDFNNLLPGDYYAIAKMNAEAKHRSLSHLNIVDLRVFSFFSRFIDLDSHLLMGDIANCIKNKKVLETSPDDMMRDYVGPSDLMNMIELVIQKNNINDFFDLYTLKPTSKFEILESLGKKYGLKYTINTNPNSHLAPTGIKKGYFSKNYKAKSIGYEPTYSSLSGIEEETRFFLS
ncbi:MAG: NAD(P)-dependent oxidoreductase [bacterium]